MKSFMLTLLYLFRLCVLIVSTPVDQHRRLYGTEAAPYIRGEWIADCNLYAPSKAIWDAGLKIHFQDWLRKDFNEWRLHRNRESYPEWFRAHWAPGVIKADMACDGLGGCSIGNCIVLHQGSEKDRQLALFNAEILANFDHVNHIVIEATEAATQDMINQKQDLVETFTFAGLLEKQAKDRKRDDDIVRAVMVSIALAAASVVGLFNPAIGSGISAASFTTTNIAKDLIANNIISLQGLVGLRDIRGDTNLKEHVEEAFQQSWANVHRDSREKLIQNIGAYITDQTTTTGRTYEELIADGSFVELDPMTRVNLEHTTKQFYMATAINYLWTDLERTYILDTDALHGSCIHDKRATYELKVCLPERPERAYWLYTLDRSEENDFATDDHATIKGPPGYYRFNKDPKHNLVNGITLEDVVRSSLWIHENNIEHKVDANFFHYLANQDDKLKMYYLKHLGKVPGAFTLPVCRNAGGEAISSVWSTKGRNFPCICSEKPWIEQRDVKQDIRMNYKFLKLTRFYASEDFEDYCNNMLHCKGDNDLSWKWNQRPGEPSPDKEMTHPWKKCKKPKPHSTWGNVEAGKHIGTRANPNHDQKRSINGTEGVDLFSSDLLWRA